MANYWWVGGSGSQSFVDPLNWATARFGAGNHGPPTNLDTAWVLDGDSKIDRGLSTADWLVLNVGFSGTIGDVGSALVSATAGSRLNYYGNGAYANIGGLASLRVWGTGGGTLYITSSNFAAGSGIEIGNGSIVVFDETTTNAGDQSLLICGGGVTFKDSGDAIDMMELHNGASVRCERQITQAELFGVGTTLTYSKNATLTLLVAHDNTVYNHASAATITTLTLEPRAKATDTFATGPFTVTTANLWPSSIYFEPRRNVITTTTVTRTCQP